MVEGLEKYGYNDEATRIRQKWCHNCFTVYDQGISITNQDGTKTKEHTLWEKYNVVNIGEIAGDGCYGPSVTGFGWTNAIFKVFAEHLKFDNNI